MKTKKHDKNDQNINLNVINQSIQNNLKTTSELLQYYKKTNLYLHHYYNNKNSFQNKNTGFVKELQDVFDDNKQFFQNFLIITGRVDISKKKNQKTKHFYEQLTEKQSSLNDKESLRESDGEDSDKGNDRGVSSRNQRLVYMNKQINYLQGIQSVKLLEQNEQIIQDIRQKLGTRLPTYYNILNILYSESKKNLYDHVYYIMKNHFQVNIPVLNQQEIQNIRDFFIKYEQFYFNIFARTNCQRYDYILYRIIKHLGITKYDQIIQLNLKTDTAIKYDAKFNQVIAEMAKIGL